MPSCFRGDIWNLAGRHYLHCLPKFGQVASLCKTIFLWKEMRFYQLDSKLIYVYRVVNLGQMFLCEVLDLHLQIQKKFSLDFLCYLLFLQQYPLLFKSVCFPVCFWMMVCWLYCVLLTVSWASNGSACSSFYKNNSLRVNYQATVL